MTGQYVLGINERLPSHYSVQAKGGLSNSLADHSLSDIAAAEIADQLHIIKNNDVLIVFLRGCVVLKGTKGEVGTPITNKTHRVEV